MDPHDSEGTNRTGVYTLNMIMIKEAPELIPLDGVRMRLQYMDKDKSYGLPCCQMCK